MDFFSHGLWAGAGYRAVNLKRQKPLKVWLAMIWGVVPDLLAFGLLFLWLFWNLIFGGMSFSDWPAPDAAEPMAKDELPIFALTGMLYNISHSLTVFLVTAGLVAFFRKNIPWEAGGWLLHILIDIPTHSYRFYPTPFLWPFSDWKFDGFSWANPWFMIVNYSSIVLVYILLRYLRTKRTTV